MLIRKISATGVLLCMLSGATPAAAADTPEDIAPMLEPLRTEFAMPGMVAAVAKGGRIVAAGAVGVRALGYDQRALTGDRIHIGSDGKAMTALVAATLVEEGALSWDTTVGEVLGDRVPGMNPKLAAVRLDQLLSHSSGIPTDTPEMFDFYLNLDAFDYNTPELRLKALDAWKHNAPVVPEGSPFQYANFGFMIAGTMMEAVTGKPWELLVQERIFDPLELASAGFGPTATPGRIDGMVGHEIRPDGTVIARLWGNAADMPQLLAPAGTVHMSILDFARWASWVAGGARRGPALVKPETLDYLLAEKVRTPRRPNPPPGTPAQGGYAMGWSVEKFDWSDRELSTHNGSNGLNLAKILVDVEKDLAIVVAVNIGGQNADKAAGQAMEALYSRFR